jgi:hypothetical protein
MKISLFEELIIFLIIGVEFFQEHISFVKYISNISIFLSLWLSCKICVFKASIASLESIVFCLSFGDSGDGQKTSFHIYMH